MIHRLCILVHQVISNETILNNNFSIFSLNSCSTADNIYSIKFLVYFTNIWIVLKIQITFSNLEKKNRNICFTSSMQKHSIFIRFSWLFFKKFHNVCLLNLFKPIYILGIGSNWSIKIYFNTFFSLFETIYHEKKINMIA